MEPRSVDDRGMADCSALVPDADMLERARRAMSAAEQTSAAESTLPPGCLPTAAPPDGHDRELATDATTRPPSPDIDDAGTVVRPGDVIDRYKLEQHIASGGMGTVWRALQIQPEDLRRTVAVKLVKHGLGSAGVLARFEVERQALAMMDHPNIATVFDAGRDAFGRSFFAMEYVPGQSLTDYCDARTLTVRSRLELFRELCLAVQHAHGRGILHRDLKPGNVLVREVDGKPMVKVIDFGIARSLGRTAVEFPSLSESGEIVGTWHYMSPEQAHPDSRGIDVRADVYSLGAILNELLCGQHVFDLRGRTLEEIRHVIRHVAASAPSVKFLSQPRSDQRAFAARVGMGASAYSRCLKRELDWIVLRCLQKDPSVRYPTAQSLAEDIENFLRRRPVRAVPAATTYVCRKFVSRHRVATSVAIGVVVAISLTAAGLLRAAADRRIARQSEAFASAMDEFLNDELIGGAGPESSGAQLSLNDALGRAAGRVAHRFDGNGPLSLRMNISFGEALLSLGDLGAADSHFARARSIIRAGIPVDRRTETGLRINEQVLKWRQSQGGDAIASLREALAIATAEFGVDDPLRLAVLHDLASALKNTVTLADAAESQSAMLAEAEALYDEAIERRVRVLGPNSLPALQSRLSRAQIAIVRGTRHIRQAPKGPDGDRQRAEARAEMEAALAGLTSVIAVAEAHGGLLDAVGVEASSESAKLLHRLGRAREAHDSYKQVLTRLNELHGVRHWRTREIAESWVNLHLLTMARARAGGAPVFTADELLLCGTASVEVLVRHLPESSNAFARASVVAAGGSKPADAEPLLLQAWATVRMMPSPDTALLRLVAQMLTDAMDSSDRSAQAEFWRARAEALQDR